MKNTLARVSAFAKPNLLVMISFLALLVAGLSLWNARESYLLDRESAHLENVLYLT